MLHAYSVFTVYISVSLHNFSLIKGAISANLVAIIRDMAVFCPALHCADLSSHARNVRVVLKKKQFKVTHCALVYLCIR